MLYLPTTPSSLGRSCVSINNISEEKFRSYGKQFSDQEFWSKIWQQASALGEEGIYTILLLYYAIKSDMPKQIKFVLIAAICYFICPTDAVPDFVPLLGYTDDLAVILYAKHKAEQYISANVTEQAKRKLLEIKEVIC